MFNAIPAFCDGPDMKAYNGECYLYFNDKLTFDDATIRCQSLCSGGHIAELQDEDEEIFLREFLLEQDPGVSIEK